MSSDDNEFEDDGITIPLYQRKYFQQFIIMEYVSLFIYGIRNLISMIDTKCIQESIKARFIL